MSPMSLLACAGIPQVQFTFGIEATEALTPESLFGKNVRESLVKLGPYPVMLGGRVVAYMVAPEDLELIEFAEDFMASQAVQKAYDEQGDKPATDFHVFMGELGLG
jgi:hypothetical protein